MTSPTVQNEIIDACYEILTRKLIAAIKAAKVYSVLMDETQDVATIGQVTNCIRYVSKKDDGQHIVHEDFVKFIPTASTTGKNHIIIYILPEICFFSLQTHFLENDL